MNNQYESCRKNLEELVKWYDKNKGDRNEATTRLHLINCLFLDCLGWSKQDIIAEEQEGGERTDYEFSAPRRVLIVEAKREGKYFELPVGTGRQIEFGIPSLCRDYLDVKEALQQVATYCQRRGAPFGAVCNGHQIVAFVASRQDGQSPLEAKALVFDSLGLMLSRFLDLWEVLSKAGVEEKKLYAKLIGEQVPQVPAKLSATIGNYPGVKRRNVFQVNLKILSDLVLEDITRAAGLEERFLRDCYCQSGALSQNSLLAKQILRARYAEVFEKKMKQPTIVPATSKRGTNPDLLSESLSRRPILLLGDVGVGKTIFMRHLIKIEAAEVLKKHIIITVDLGSQVALAMDVRSAILKLIEDQLREDYRVDIEEGKFVRSVYRDEIRRFSEGIYKDLKETNANVFKQKELEFLEGKLRRRHEHIRCSLEYLVRLKKKQVMFFLDNADQRVEEGVQEQAFLIAQEIAENWPTMVFVALRPETFHRSYKRGGSLSGYHPKAFTISPPRIDRVLERRLKFASLVCTGKIPLQQLKSTQIELEGLTVIIRSFLQSMVWSNELVNFIDNISGGNIRLALDLVREFFGSGHVDTQKIVEKYKESGHYYVRIHEFLRSVIYGDCEHYDATKSCITNIFDVNTLDPKEHFLISLLIRFLNNEGQKGEHGFVEISRVYERLQDLGFTAEQIDRAIVRACRSKLVETGGRKTPDMVNETTELLRATSVGLYHVEQLSRMFSYVDAIIVDTPVLDKDTREAIHDVDDITERLDRAEVFRKYLDKQWKGLDGGTLEFDWLGVSNALGANIKEVREKAEAIKARGCR